MTKDFQCWFLVGFRPEILQYIYLWSWNAFHFSLRSTIDEESLIISAIELNWILSCESNCDKNFIWAFMRVLLLQLLSGYLYCLMDRHDFPYINRDPIRVILCVFCVRGQPWQIVVVVVIVVIFHQGFIPLLMALHSFFIDIYWMEKTSKASKCGSFW